MGPVFLRPDEKGLCSLTVECLRSDGFGSALDGGIATRILRISRRDMEWAQGVRVLMLLLPT